MFKNNRCYDGQMNYTNKNFESAQYTQAMPAEGAAMSNPYMAGQGMIDSGCMMPPIYECPQERVCHREIFHEVPHICPINTRIINHHIYKHTYTPCYTSCEENEVCNVYEGCCNKF